MKSATKADKIRLSWHLKRFKNLIGVLHKIFNKKYGIRTGSDLKNKKQDRHGESSAGPVKIHAQIL